MASMIAKTKTGIGSKATKIWNECETHGFQVRLYETMVYEEKLDGTIVLCNGGWNTPTTAQRINSALVYRGFDSGISTAGVVMTYNGKPFVDGVLVLKVSDLRREKIESDKKHKEYMANWEKENGLVA